MTLSSLVVVLLAIGVVLLGYMAFLFWTDPAKGLRITTHRLENLPTVMANRYTGLAVLSLGMILYGNYPIITVFFLSAAIMALSDSMIYARAGHSFIKHTASGVLSVIGMIISAIAWATTPVGG